MVATQRTFEWPNIYIYVCVCVRVFMLEDNTEVDQKISFWRSELDSLDSVYGAI